MLKKTITNKAIEDLNRLLSLPATGKEQDWEHELADKNRIEEFLDILRTSSFSPEHRFAMMSLIFSSFDDYLFDNIDINGKLWTGISEVLSHNVNEFKDLLDYWADWNANEEDSFDITPLVRKYFKDHHIVQP